MASTQICPCRPAVEQHRTIACLTPDKTLRFTYIGVKHRRTPMSAPGRLRMRPRSVALIVALASVLVGIVAVASPRSASAAGTVTYSATQTIPVPPASSYAGSGSGDGWAVALSSRAVYNVLHHSAWYPAAPGQLGPGASGAVRSSPRWRTRPAVQAMAIYPSGYFFVTGIFRVSSGYAHRASYLARSPEGSSAADDSHQAGRFPAGDVTRIERGLHVMPRCFVR